MSNIFSDKDPVPNDFTERMGELIRIAREEAGWSQKRLADEIFRRRATVSDIENGKSEVGTLTLARIANALDKPLVSFYPEGSLRELAYGELDPDDIELLFHFTDLYDENLRKSAIGLVKSLAEYSPVTSIEKMVEIAQGNINHKNFIQELHEKKKKK